MINDCASRGQQGCFEKFITGLDSFSNERFMFGSVLVILVFISTIRLNVAK